ncbi:MAG: Gfo/Idh/MocA family oxidoreductase [Methylacidiphilales bacterium]|nr:Gfo/Idh/MocA family oxidoreductase [Candidatus Methylacidiphilales bacterium]
MKALSTVRFGFIGAGQIAYYAAEAVLRHPHAKLVAVQDLHMERLKTLQAKHSLEFAHETAEELLENDAVDAVYIAVPNKFHVPLAIQALKAGKHVILEKPFAMNAAEAEKAIETAKSAGRVFTLGMNFRFSADSQKIRQLVEESVLGDIYHAKAYWMRRTGIPKLGTWFGSKAVAGGGSLYDIGVHMLDLCLYTINNFEPVSVVGATYTKFGNRGLGEGGWGLSDRTEAAFDVDDFASAFIRFANGASVTLDTSWACHQADGNSENVEIFGTEAGATLRPARLFRSGAGHPALYEIVDDLKVPLKMPHQERFHNFINHLRGEEELCVTTHQALVVQKILDGIAESSRTGREVRIA